MKTTMELSKVEIITNMAKVEALRQELGKFGISGMTVFEANNAVESALKAKYASNAKFAE